MSEQPDLWSEPAAPARRGSLSTSVNAAKSVAVTAGRQKVLELMRIVRACTDEQLVAAAERYGIELSPSGIRTRRDELVAAGFVRDSGRTAKTKSGRSAVVWEIVEKGQVAS